MSNQLRLLGDDAAAPAPGAPGEPTALRGGPARPRRRRQQGPSAAAAGRIDTSTRRAGRAGVAEARRALVEATTEAELRRAG